MLRVAQVRLNYAVNPVGTGRNLRLNWILESNLVNVRQTAYSLQLSEEESFGDCLYESGWVESDRSAQVKLPATDRLESCRRYYLRVKVRAAKEESPYSAPATFVTGILDNAEWEAEFITGERPEDWEHSAGSLLQKKILLSGEVAEAYACTTALGVYHFHINGERVGEDELTPGWTSYLKHLCYQTYDVTEKLHKGENTLSALLGAGWYKGKMGFLHLRNNYGERTAFLMQLLVRYRDGRMERFVTDTSWLCAEGPVLFSEIYDGEICDGRKEAEWKTETEAVLFPREVLTPQADSRVRIVERIPAQRIFTTPKGECVVDFGQNLTGWLECTFRAGAGEELHYKCFETLDAEGNVYLDNLRTAKQEIRYICRGGEETYHPHFTFQGFRYAVILEFPGERTPESFTALVVHTDMEQTGHFSCSHPLLNRLQHNILWSLKGNFLDIPTDCPQRDERVGWTGDAQIFCRTACYLMNAYTFYEKWLTDLAADQTQEGGVPHVVPDIISGKEQNDWLLSQGTHSAAGWADAAVINPWVLYLTYGDTDILKRQYGSMKRWIGFMESHAQDYIWNYRLQFGDWVALDAEEGSYYGATPNDLTCTAYFAYSTGLFVKVATLLGEEEDAARYRTLYEKIVDKFRRTFFAEDGRMTAQTQTAHILALCFDLVPQKHRKQTANRLTELLAEHDGHLVTGFLGTPGFCRALSDNGYVDEAYELLLKEDFPSWLYQVKMGATTIWEHWDGMKPDGTMWSPDMNSFNHYAYGAIGDWLYRVILGLDTDEEEPGYSCSVISPKTGNVLSWAEGSYQSVYGTIGVRWERHPASEGTCEIELTVRVPENTTARVCLEEGARLCEQDKEAEEREKTLQFQQLDGILTAKTGSGVWSVRYRKPASTPKTEAAVCHGAPKA